MEKLIVIANLGRVRPVKFRQAGDDPREKAHLEEMPDSVMDMRPETISEVVTDQAGRAPQSRAVDRRGGMSYGEEHNLQSELEKQALERVAGKISEIVAAEGHPAWRLVAPQTIAGALTEVLSSAARKCLGETLPADLTNLPLAELEKRFLKAN